MACVKPLIMSYGENKENFVQVPCGWCLACRQDKLDMWSARCEYQLMESKCGAFVTYNYKDSALPKNGSVDKSHPKLLADRLRSRTGIKFKYLISSEYGDNILHTATGLPLGRPHLHCLFFGLDYKEHRKLFFDVWKDFTDPPAVCVYPITNGAVRYVMKYVLKEIKGKEMEKLYGSYNLVPPFAHFSKGLGANYYYDNKDWIINHNFTTRYKGRDIPVPSYYLKKMGILKPYVNLSPKYFEMSFARYFNTLTLTEKQKMLKLGFYSGENNFLVYQQLQERSNLAKNLELEKKHQLELARKI